MPFTPTANQDIWNPQKWKDQPTADAIDNARHVGALSTAQILPSWQGQLGDIAGGVEAQRSARSQANTLLTPQGREAQVKSYGANAQQQAYQLGRKMAAQLSQQGIQGQEAATQLSASNQAARATNAYRADMNSPQGLAQLFQMLMQLNDPQAIASLWPLIAQFDQQDFPRQQFHEQMSAQDAAQNGLGGAFGQLLGLATQFGMPGMGAVNPAIGQVAKTAVGAIR